MLCRDRKLQGWIRTLRQLEFCDTCRRHCSCLSMSLNVCISFRSYCRPLVVEFLLETVASASVASAGGGSLRRWVFRTFVSTKGLSGGAEFDGQQLHGSDKGSFETHPDITKRSRKWMNGPQDHQSYFFVVERPFEGSPCPPLKIIEFFGHSGRFQQERHRIWAVLVMVDWVGSWIGRSKTLVN